MQWHYAKDKMDDDRLKGKNSIKRNEEKHTTIISAKMIRESSLEYLPKRLENNQKCGIYLAVVYRQEQQTSIGGIITEYTNSSSSFYVSLIGTRANTHRI